MGISKQTNKQTHNHIYISNTTNSTNGYKIKKKVPQYLKDDISLEKLITNPGNTMLHVYSKGTKLTIIHTR